MLLIDKLDSGYGAMQVLWRVNVTIENGKITALLGPNGAGKSTLLRTIIGILKPWSGKINYNGIDLTNAGSDRKVQNGITAVLEGRHLFSGMTIYENLLLGAYTKRARQSFSDSLELVYSLFPILKQRNTEKAGTLSGGQQQMLSIGRALMTKPEVILLDEPSQGLAPKLTEEILTKIQELKERGLTVLLVEQSAYDALDVSDNAYVLNGGKVILQGPADEVSESKELQQIYLGI